jgi:opacity protein-like surface antigen
MIFATGGYASADLKTAACNSFTTLCDGPNSNFNGASRNNGWYAGGGLDYVVHQGPLVDVILGAEYQHFDVSKHNAFCFNPSCNVATGWDEDLSAKGDIVRARLTRCPACGGWIDCRDLGQVFEHEAPLPGENPAA